MRSGTKIRKRGRPRSFDAQVALQAAEQTFLRRGYAATTLDDLSAAMHINRPSLYAAFSSKEALYQKALAAYSQRMGRIFQEALEEPVFAKALKNLYSAALDAYVDDDGEAVGCMVACTAVTEAATDDVLCEQTKSIMDDIDALIARRVERAIADGELPQTVKATARSRLVVGVLHTLAIRTRAGAGRKVLDAIAADAAALLSRGP